MTCIWHVTTNRPRTSSFRYIRIPNDQLRTHTLTMICRRCLKRLASGNATPFSRRAISSSASRRAQAVTAQTTTATNSRPNDKPAATSTSAAQPFSTPLTSSPDRLNLPIQKEQSKAAAKIVSSVPAGTVLRGLNFLKNKQDPIAMEDHEYPAWLWTVLADKSDADGNEASAEGDLFCTPDFARRT